MDMQRNHHLFPSKQSRRSCQSNHWRRFWTHRISSTARIPRTKWLERCKCYNRSIILFHSASLGAMHCITKYNHPTTCDFAPDAWACANANDTCNDPGTLTPSASPTRFPSLQPTHYPSGSPSLNPTKTPTVAPSLNPTKTPTVAPSLYPTLQPSSTPTISPSNDPTLHPTHLPTVPTLLPSYNPTVATTPRMYTTGTVTIASTNIIQSTKANYDGSISTPIDCAYITFLERCLNSVFYAFGAVSLTWYIFKFVQRRRK
eukprot:633403_1